MSAIVEFRKKLGSFSLDVSFEAGGEVLALLGGSGCGKSMTLKCIAGIVTPDEGRIIVNGVTFYDSAAKINLKPQRRHVGLLFQNYALFPNMTTRQNIMTVLEHGAGRRENKEERYKEIAERFFISGLEDHYPSQLSGGQQQRVSIGRALITHPALILADEPTGNLDRKNSAEIIELLKLFNRQYSQTLLVITHDENIALQADRILAVEDGKIVQDETLHGREQAQ